MKRFIGLLFFLFAVNFCYSQNIPNEWTTYLFDGYMTDIKEAKKGKKISEQSFLQQLEQEAIKGLAKQINQRIESKSALKKSALNGISSVTFESSTDFSTDVQLDLVKSKVHFDNKSKTGYAIAFIDKAAARNFYHKQCFIYFGKVETALQHAKSLKEQGGKKEGKEELLGNQQYLEKLAAAIDRLVVFDYPESELQPLLVRANAIEREVKGILAEAKNSVASVYFNCNLSSSVTTDSDIQKNVKNVLTKNNCIFTSDKSKADWAIYANTKISDRAPNAYGVYFCDAVTVLKIMQAQTGLVIYEEELKHKEGSTTDHARAALELQKELGEEIAQNVLDRIFSEEFVYVYNDGANAKESSNFRSDNSTSRSGGSAFSEYTAPPEIVITSPLNNGFYVDEIQIVEFEIDSDGPMSVSNIEVNINGVETTDISEFKFRNKKGSFKVRLARRGQCNLAVRAKNNYGYGEASLVRLRRKNVISKPRLNILAIGINDYKNNEIEDLDFAAKDAADIIETITKSNGGIFEKVNSKILMNQQATKENILEGLSWIESNSLQNDISVIFIAGHGGKDNRDNYYFFPYEANPNALRSSCLPYSEFNRTMQILINDMEAKAIFLSDACHSGGALKTRSASARSVIHELSSIEDGAFSFASSTGAQKSIEDSKWENGAFTEALIRGIKGKADVNKDNTISIVELITFATNEVRALTDNKQSPMHSTLKGNDFPFIFIPEK